MLKRLSQIKSLDAFKIRMIPNPKPKGNNSEPFGNGTDLMRYRPNTAYCIATQSGFWNREFLAKLAEGKSSIWEFERYGSFDPMIAANHRNHQGHCLQNRSDHPGSQRGGARRKPGS